MKSIGISLAFLVLLFLTACQATEAPVTEENPLPSETPQFSIETANQSLDTATQTLCWEECGNSEAFANDQLGDLDNLAQEAPSFQVDGQQNLEVELTTSTQPTRFSYMEYETDGDSTSIVTENIEEGIIEVTGNAPKTYIVGAEWYDEDNENLLGSIYTVFTLEH